MMPVVAKRKLIRFFLLFVMCGPAYAFTPFTIHAIQVQGLQRLEKGTVLTYLPVSAGDRLNDDTARRSIRALYGTGLFKDVQLARSDTSAGPDLLVKVQERPAISSFKISGNTVIDSDKLNKALRRAGMAEGELFRRSLLQDVKQEMRRQYYSNGYYGIQIKSDVTHLSNNRVKVAIHVTEGQVATIKSINIVGNKSFSDEQLRKTFNLSTPTALSWFTKNDRYSRQKLVGDLEGLSSYYQDRGYLKFSIDSVQVALSPDKHSIYITINVSEGQRYRVNDTTLAGRLILPASELKPLITLRKGDVYSQKAATDVADNISNRLADQGYAFAKVTPQKQIVPGTHKVNITFAVDPGDRVYVRRITFGGNVKTNDETLRREMRQFEGAWFSRAAVQRSRTRLARLPFVESVNVSTKRVPGSSDLVDINYDITERAPGQVQLGLGFSGAQGILISGAISHNDFLGTGDTVSARFDNSTISRIYSASWTDPYATTSGISRTVSAYYEKTDRLVRDTSGFDTKTISGSIIYGIPLSEYSSASLGAGIQDTKILVHPNDTSQQVINFVNDNGDNALDYLLKTGIKRDTRNRTIFATRGSLNKLDLNVAVPGSDLTYYRATFNDRQFLPLGGGFTLKFDGTVGYGHGYGQHDVIPPYEHFFAGGFDTVRGFRDGSLGPRDSFDNPYGGAFETVLQTDLILPTPLASNNKSTRFTAFYDMGNVYAQPGDFNFSSLRSSAGVAFYWFTPYLGVIKVSLAYPIRKEHGDDIRHFQVSFGTGF